MSGRSWSVLVSVFAVMLLFAGMLSVPVAHAATFDVNTTADGNDFDTMDGVCSINPPAQPIVCTLRAAVQQANAAGAGPHIINLPAGTYAVGSGMLPQLTLDANVAIVGVGEASTVIDGFLVSGCGSGCTIQPKTVTISGLTIRNAPAFGVSNPAGAGPMTLDHVTISGNGINPIPSLRGGGIDNRATMTLTNVTVRDNNLVGSNNVGGISNFGGQSNLTATNLTVTGNHSDGNAAGIRSDNGGFPPGGRLTINGGTISGNSSNLGLAGGLTSNGIVTLTNVTVSGNANVGAGSGIGGIVGGINASGTLALNNVAITGNQVAGTPGVGGVGGLAFTGGSGLTITGGSIVGNGGAGANVGGLYYSGQGGTISGTPVQNNTGNAADAQTGGRGGIEATGSGLAISDLTISGNTGAGNNTAAGLLVRGGGHTVERVTISGNTGVGLRPLEDVDVRNVTVSGNTGDGVHYTESQGITTLTNVTIANSGGAGIRSTSNSLGPLRVKNTLVANSSGGNCVTPAGRPLQSLGSNLSSDTTCATSFTAAGDQNNVNPLLGPLQDNGGPTQTQALLQGSPAVNAVTAGNCPPPSTDQRGVTRPQGSACDIGAYEFQPATVIAGDINLDGIVDIRDYGIWRQNFGQTNCGNVADLDSNCIVDIRDYGIWRQHFGQVSGAGVPSGARGAAHPPATPTPTRPPGGSPARP